MSEKWEAVWRQWDGRVLRSRGKPEHVKARVIHWAYEDIEANYEPPEYAAFDRRDPKAPSFIGAWRYIRWVCVCAGGSFSIRKVPSVTTPPAQATAAVTEVQRIRNHLMTERALQECVIEMAERLGCLVFHDYDSRRSTPGFPDLVVVGKHSVLFIELKRQGGKLRPEQKVWQERLTVIEHAHSWLISHHVWRPSDWHEGVIEEVLREA